MKFYIQIIFTILLLLPISGYAQQPPTPVFIANIKQILFTDEIEALGTLKAYQDVELTSSVTALVTKVNFNDGQRVSQGDVLVEMDAEEEMFLKAEELSRLNEAKRQLARLKPLVSRGAVSRSTLDEAELELLTAQARIKGFDSIISKRQIVAPFDGVVGLRNISVGALAQPGMLICTIDNDSLMKLDFSVPSIFLTALKRKLKIEATSKAYVGEIFTGEITSVDSRVNPATRTVVVRALLENSDHKLKPGLLMGITLQANARQALTIPEESLLFQGEKKSVFVVQTDSEGTTVRSITIETGARRDGEVEVLSGLSGADQVVTHGITRIRTGSRIIVKAKDSGRESLKELLNQKTLDAGDKERG